ncbi:MAG: hypothetical protein ACRC91_05125 [Aeromonas sp.]
MALQFGSGGYSAAGTLLRWLLSPWLSHPDKGSGLLLADCKAQSKEMKKSPPVGGDFCLAIGRR